MEDLNKRMQIVENILNTGKGRLLTNKNTVIEELKILYHYEQLTSLMNLTN